MKAFAPLFALALGATHMSHVALREVVLPETKRLKETLPSVDALGFMSMGYTNLVADYYWLRAVSHFGSPDMHEANYPNLKGLITRVLNLDPYFAAAYIFAGTSMTVQGQDYKTAIELLDQGAKLRPDEWRIPFLLGFNTYYFEKDYARAALALAQAARHPEAPPVAGHLAIRLTAEAGQPETGLRLVDSLASTLTDERLLETYAQRRKLLQLELDLKHLQMAIDHYTKQQGQPPATLADLLRAGIITRIPEEPLGGSYSIKNGTIQTTSESQRLRLAPNAKGLPDERG